MNFEQFQNKMSSTRMLGFLDANQIEFVIIDEVHFAKQRSKEKLSE